MITEIMKMRDGTLALVQSDGYPIIYLGTRWILEAMIEGAHLDFAPDWKRTNFAEETIT